jgi:thiazole synthase
LRLAREIGGWKLVKLEVLGDKKNLFPDMIETLKSTEVLTKEGFQVMVYCNDDTLMSKRLENVGACAIMPLAAPIGSGLGIQNTTNIKIIRSQTKLPLIIDAGLGQASDATIAMELGCDGVLANTAIAKAKKPFQMALAFKNAVTAGRQSFLAGRIEKSIYGSASSPTTGII